MKNVAEIIEDYLKANNFHGLTGHGCTCCIGNIGCGDDDIGIDCRPTLLRVPSADEMDAQEKNESNELLAMIEGKE